jgi:hypothetical protein
VRLVEDAMEALVAARPSGRGPGVPAAEAVAGFEEGIRAARETMSGWRSSDVEVDVDVDAWRACLAGLDEASRRAERLRLEPPPEGYEELYGALGDLLEPLEVFAHTLDRLR